MLLRNIGLVLTICTYMCLSTTVFANAIDSLKTKKKTGSDNVKVKEIYFRSHGAWSALFELKIDANGWATCEIHESKLRIFAGRIDSVSLGKLIQTIDHIKPFSLSDRYPIAGLDTMVGDLETYELELKFNSGVIKKVSDYGGKGTDELQNLYQQLFDLAQNLKELL